MVRQNVEERLFDEFKKCGRDLFLSHMISSHGGNMSVASGRDLVITRRGAMLGHLTPTDLVRVRMEVGEESVTRDEEKGPSSELPVHRAIYRRTDAKSVIHAHPALTVGLSLVRDRIEPVDWEGGHYMPVVEVVSGRSSVGSEDVLEDVARALSGSRMVVVRGHGTFCKGDSLEEALFYTTSLEQSCAMLMARDSFDRE